MAPPTEMQAVELEAFSGSEGSGDEADTAGAFRELFSNKILWLLVFVPVALGLALMGESTKPVYKFVANFCAIIPLAWLISEATEHLEKIVGPTWGVLLNSTFGNVVEIILSVQAIRAGLIKVVQSSLLGAILMNLLFVTGCCFLTAGTKKHSMEFNTHCASYNLSLLGVAMLALIVPTDLAVHDEWSTPDERMKMSLFVAGILALMYVQWLVFNLFSHTKLFTQKQIKPKATHHHHHYQGSPKPLPNAAALEAAVDKAAGEESGGDDSDDEEDGPRMACAFAVALLGACTVLVSFHCDWLVESIEPVTKELGIKQAFVATVLLPMVGNFSEEIAAVSIAAKGKVDLAMGVAIGSATQIALLVIPIAVFLAKAMGTKFDLDFEVFQVKLLLAAVLVAALCLRDGQANWLKGTMMMTAYVIVATAFFYIHDKEFESAGKPLVDSDVLQGQLKAMKEQIAQLMNANHVEA